MSSSVSDVQAQSNKENVGLLIDLTDEEHVQFPSQLTTQAEVDDTFGIFEFKKVRSLSAPTSSSTVIQPPNMDCFSPIFSDDNRVECCSNNTTTINNNNNVENTNKASIKILKPLQLSKMLEQTSDNSISNINNNSINFNNQSHNNTTVDSSMEKSKVSHHRILAGSASILGLNDGFIVDSSSTSITSGDQTTNSFDIVNKNSSSSSSSSSNNNTVNGSKKNIKSSSNELTKTATELIKQHQNTKSDRMEDSVFISPITVNDDSPSRGAGIGSLSDESGLLEIENLSTFTLSDGDTSGSNESKNKEKVSETEQIFEKVFKDPKTRKKSNDVIAKKVQEMFDAASPSKNPDLYTSMSVHTHNFSTPFAASTTTNSSTVIRKFVPQRSSIGPSLSSSNTTSFASNASRDTILYGTPSRRHMVAVHTPRQFTPIRRDYDDDDRCFQTPSVQQQLHSSSTPPSCHEETTSPVQSTRIEATPETKKSVSRLTPRKLNLNDSSSRLPTPSRLSFSSSSSSGSSGGGGPSKNFQRTLFPGKNSAKTAPHLKIQSMNQKVGYNKGGINVPKLKLLESSKTISKGPQPLKAMHKITTCTTTTTKVTVGQESSSPSSSGKNACYGSAPVHRKFIPPIAASSPKIISTYEMGTPPRNKRMSNVRSSGYGQQSVKHEANTSIPRVLPSPITTKNGPSPARRSVPVPTTKRKTMSNDELQTVSSQRSFKENNPEIKQKFGFRH